MLANTTPNQKKLGQYGKCKYKKKAVIYKFTLTCISLHRMNTRYFMFCLVNFI